MTRKPTKEPTPSAPPQEATSTAPQKAPKKVAKTAPKKVAKTAKTAKKAGRALPILPSDDTEALTVDETALSARWPEPVLVLSDDERTQRVRQGLDSVLLDDVKADGSRVTRGFVRAVLRVPLTSPRGRVYGVFVEVDRAGYAALQRAFREKTETRITAKLATRLPFLDDAYGCDVTVVEDGSDLRARVVDATAPSLISGPTVGPRLRRTI